MLFRLGALIQCPLCRTHDYILSETTNFSVIIDKTYLMSYHFNMKYFDWDPEKNAKLQNEREVSFEDVLVALEEGRLLTILEHPSKTKYPNQKIFVIELHGYAYLVPFVEDDEKYFLKTIIPSRKMTKEYLAKGK